MTDAQKQTERFRKALNLLFENETVETIASALCRLDCKDPRGLVSVNGGPFKRGWEVYEEEAKELLDTQERWNDR